MLFHISAYYTLNLTHIIQILKLGDRCIRGIQVNIDLHDTLDDILDVGTLISSRAIEVPPSDVVIVSYGVGGTCCAI